MRLIFRPLNVYPRGPAMKGPIDISTAVQAAALALDSALTPGPDGFIDSGTIQGAATAARAILNALGEGLAAEFDRILEATGAWEPPAVEVTPLPSIRLMLPDDVVEGTLVRVNGGTWRITHCLGNRGNEGGSIVFIAKAGSGETLELSRRETDSVETIMVP